MGRAAHQVVRAASQNLAAMLPLQSAIAAVVAIYYYYCWPAEMEVGKVMASRFLDE